MVDATVLLIRETYCGGYRYPETLFGTMFPNPTFKLNNNMNLLGIWIRGRCLCDSQRVNYYFQRQLPLVNGTLKRCYDTSGVPLPFSENAAKTVAKSLLRQSG